MIPGGSGSAGVTLGTGTAVATSTTVGIQPAPGQLTAGTWDDNLNFDFYLSYLNKTVASQAPGLPIIDRTARMVILVKTVDGQPVAGAQVVLTDSAANAFTMTTGAEGRVLYFPGWLGIAAGTSVTVTASLAGDVASQTVVAAAGTVELTLAQTARPAVPALDLAFVVDTTGSMGDELRYLQAEVGNIVNEIATQFPNVNQRWGLVFYRDTGDVYVVRSFDFTSNLATFQQNLAAQSADGGGDTPEAVDQGLAAANQLSWRAGTVARVQFWIADAPHHVGREAAVVSALHDTVVNSVHIYPVAGSGIDDLGEFTMRTAAEVTGGRYLFLTDDSGIGGSHEEPHIPCYYVTTLESAMHRMLATELTGAYVAPTASEIIRTGGDPQSQLCTLSDGGTVTAW
jgi:von Willebrand factor type A domain